MNDNQFYSMFNNAVKDVIKSIGYDTFLEEVLPKVRENLIENFGFAPQVIEIKTDKEVKRKAGIFHNKFNDVLNLVSINVPVYLSGKAGTGKNVIASEVADCLGLDFYFTNAVTQEYKLTGFIDAYGNYQETQFYKAFTNGGLFFLDEMDASIPEALVILNAALANGYFDFPCGKKYAHKDFYVIAAGNTTGHGADTIYTSRCALDGASLDRFAYIEIDYDLDIELNLARNNYELLNFIHGVRDIVDKKSMPIICSYRAIDRIAKIQSCVKNIDIKDILSMALFKGIDVDDLTIIANALMEDIRITKNNKYLIGTQNLLKEKKGEPKN